MAIYSVSERVWERPTQRQTWDAARTYVRSLSAMRSTAALPDAIIDECIDRAIDNAWPKCFVHEIWKTQEITAAPESITLPWAPYAYFNCYWWDQSDTVTTAAHAIPKRLWEVENDSWRWLGDDNEWLSSNRVMVTLEAIGKPVTRQAELEAAPDNDPVYCPLSMQSLAVLVLPELMFQLAMQRAPRDFQTIGQVYANQREQARQSLPRMRWPAHQGKRYIQNVSTAVFVDAGTDNVDLADMR